MGPGQEVMGPGQEVMGPGQEVMGPGQEGNSFSVQTVRTNPAASGAITGKQTYGSFSSSLFGKYVDLLCYSVYYGFYRRCWERERSSFVLKL